MNRKENSNENPLRIGSRKRKPDPEFLVETALAGGAEVGLGADDAAPHGQIAFARQIASHPRLDDDGALAHGQEVASFQLRPHEALDDDGRVADLIQPLAFQLLLQDLAHEDLRRDSARSGEATGASLVRSPFFMGTSTFTTYHLHTPDTQFRNIHNRSSFSSPGFAARVSRKTTIGKFSLGQLRDLS